MASILTFIGKAGGVFDDRVTQIMGEAFDRACKDLHDKGQPEIVYEVIAKRIIEAVKNGERDPIRLRKAGLAALGATAVIETGWAAPLAIPHRRRRGDRMRFDDFRYWLPAQPVDAT